MTESQLPLKTEPISSVNPQFVKIGKAASLLGVSIDTIRRWEKRGQILPIKTLGGTRLYDKSQLQKLNPNLKVDPKPFLSPMAPASRTPDIFLSLDRPILKTINELEPEIYSLESEKGKGILRSLLWSSSLKQNLLSLILVFISLSSLFVPGLLLSNYLKNTQTVSDLTDKLNENPLVQVSGLTQTLASIFSSGSPSGNLTQKLNDKTGPAQMRDLSSLRDAEASKLLSSVAAYGEVLAESSPSASFLQINLNTEINGDASVSGTLTAPNILYSLVPGNNIAITGDPQRPTIDSTLTIDTATTTTIGIASFSDSFFTVSAGAVSLKSGGITTTEIKDGTVANGDLANSKVTVTAGSGLTGGGDVALGSSITLTSTLGTSITASEVAADSLDFTEFKDTMALDATTDIATAGFNLTTSGTGSISFANTGTFAVTGITTLTGNLNANGGLDVDDAFVVADGGVLTTSQTANFDGSADFDGDVLISDTNIAFDGASTTFTTTGAFTITPGGTVTIGDGGDALSIDSSEFDVSSSTGAITINDGGDAGNISIEGTVLDINSLDFVGAGTLTTGSNTSLTITPGGTGDTVVSIDADSNLQITSSAAPGVDIVAITDGGNNSTTDNVDGLSLTFGVSAASGDLIHLTPSYADATAGSTSETFNIIDVDAFTATQNASTDTGLIRGLNVGNLTQTETSGTITASAIRIGTGWDDIFNYNGTTVINGTGQVVSTQITGTLFSNSSDSNSGTNTIIQGDTLTINGGTNGIDTTLSNDTYTLNLDTTEIGTTTFGSGSSLVWTFDAGSVDPTIDFNSGSIVINEGGADLDFRIESDSNESAFVVDAGALSGVGAIGIGSAPHQTRSPVFIDAPAYTAALNINNSRVHIVSSNAVTAPTGTTPLITTLFLAEPNITATGTVTNASTLYIEAAPTEGGTGNYALWVDSGATQLDGTLTVEGASTFNSDVDFSLAGGENVVLTNATNTTAAAGLLDINGTGSTSDSRTLDVTTTFSSTGATTSYGLSNVWASSAVVTGAAVSQTGYGIYNTATKTGADDATGTYTLYGSYNTASNTGRTAAGTVNTYGGYFSATGDAAGTTTAYGIYAAAQSADTNWGVYSAAGQNYFSANTFINDTSNANLTLGLTINQGANDDEILALKSSDVAHGITDVTETDTYGYFKKRNATLGGFEIEGLATSTGDIGTLVSGTAIADNTTKTSSGVGAVYIRGRKKSGTTTADLGTDANILAISNNNTTKFLLDAEGDLWLAGDIESLGGTEIAINESSADVDFRIESNGNANAFNLDANLFSGVGQLSIGSAAQGTATAFTVIDNPAITATSNQNFYKLLVDNSAAVTITGATTSTIVSSLAIDEPNITATGTVTNAATLYLSSLPTEGGTTNSTILFGEDFSHVIRVQDQTTANTAGDSLTIQTGAGLGTTATAAGGALSLASGAGGALSATASTAGAGGAFSITGGVGGATSGAVTGSTVGGAGAGLTFTAGAGGAATGGSVANTSGAGGAISLVGGAAGAASGTGPSSGNGGAITITSGAVSAGSASNEPTSGTVTISSGNATADSNRTAHTGALTIQSGAPSNGSSGTGGNSGALTLQSANGGTAGNANAGASGLISIKAGAGGATSGSGTGGASGGITLTPGAGGNAGTGNAAGGNAGTLTIAAGVGGNGIGTGAGGAGSSFALTAGNGGTTTTGTGGAAGTISLVAGNGGVPSGAGTGVVGGNVTLTAGNGSLALAGGALSLTGGQGGATGAGGALTLTTGAGGGTSGASGALTILTGNVSSGTAGNVNIDVGTSTSGNGSILIGNAARAQTITIGNTSNTAVTTFSSAVATGTTTSSAWVFSDSSLTSGTGIYLTGSNTTGVGVDLDLNSLSSGTALDISSTATSFNGELLTLSKTGASGSTAFTSDIANITYSQTFNATVASANTGNALDISRAITVDDSTAGAITATVSGAVVTISDNCTAGTADTCTNSANVLLVDQNYTSTGSVLAIENAGTGSGIALTSSSTGVLATLDATGTSTTADGILIRATDASGVITDAIDVSDAEIVNAINVGVNTILGTAAVIDFSEFDVSGSTGAITINDDGNAGNISIEGTVLDIDSLDFVGAGTLTSAATTNLTLTPGTTGDLTFSTDADTTATFSGSAEGTANVILTAGDLTITDGDLNISGGEIAATADDTTGTSFSFTGVNTTGTALGVTANSISTGTAASISSTSTAGGGSGSSKLLDLARSGTNSNATHTAYGLYSSVTNTGTTSTNVGIYSTASGATNNYAAVFAAGNVGIGDTTPGAPLEVGDGTDSIQISSVGDITFVDADGAASITGPQGGALGIAAANSQALNLTTTTAGNISLDPAGAGDITLVPDNSNSSFLNISGLTSATGTALCVDGSNNVYTCSAGSSSATLQSAYNAGATITTTDNKDIDFTLDDTTTSSNFDIDIVSDNTVSISRLNNAVTDAPTQLLLLENLDVNLTIANGILFNSANAGVITDAIDASDADIVNAINVGNNLALFSTIQAAELANGTLTIEDTSGNDLITIVDDGTKGTLTVGDLTLTDLSANGGTALCIATNIVYTCDAGSGSSTLQSAYNTDGDGSDAIIALTSADDSLIFRNPASSGTDSGYVLSIDQLATGAVDGVRIANAGTGNSLDLTNTSITLTSGDLIQGDHTATYTASATYSGNLLDLSRSLTASGASTTLTVSGAVASITDNCATALSGTCTHSGSVLALTQSYASSTGTVLALSNAGTGMTISVTDDDLIGLGTAAARIEFDDQTTDEVNILDANVGIGTATPQLPLNVYRSTSNTNLINGVAQLDTFSTGDMADGFGGGLYFNIGDGGQASSANTVARIGGVRNGADTSGALAFDTASSGTLTRAMTIDSSQNVGIGDTTPNALFDIDSAATTTDISGITSTALTTGKALLITATGQGFTSGNLINASLTQSAATGTSVSGDIANLSFAPTYSTAVTTPAISGNVLDISRTSTTNSSFVSTLTVSGALASFVDTSTQTTGTLTHTANVLFLDQNYSSSTGDVLALENAGTGDGIQLTSSSTGDLANLIASGSGTTANGIIISNSSSGAITDALDVSDTEIGNALNAGANFVLFDGIRQFSSSSTVLTIEDTDGNDLCTITDGGTTGNLSCTGTIGGSGTVGFWSKSGTTLSPATANDIVSIANTTTTGADLAITNTGVYTGTGIFNLTANSATTGNIAVLSGTGMTTGEILDITGTWAPTDGSTNEAIDLNITHTPTTLADNFRAIDLDTSDGTALGNTVYNYDGTLTLTGNAAKVGYGIYQTVTSSSTTADTLYASNFATTVTGIMTTGTRNVYGVYSNPSAGAESTGGTTNVFGGYYKADADVAAGGTVNGYGLYVANGTYDTDGTSTQTGLYVESPTGADTNYAAIFAGGNVGIGSTTPGAKLQIDGDASGKGLILKANATTPGNSTEWQDSSANVLGYVSGAGVLVMQATTNGNSTFTANTTGFESNVNLVGQNSARVRIRRGANTQNADFILNTGGTDYASFSLDTGADSATLQTTNNNALTISAHNAGISFTAGATADFTFNIDSDTDIRTSGGADGTDAFVIPAGDILLSDGDLDLSGGDFNVTLDSGDGVTITGTQPASVGTTPGTAATAIIGISPATGGNTTIATTGVGGVGSGLSWTLGTGGTAASANTASTGGAGGAYAITSGTGGAAAATGTNVGGAGGALTLTGGTGGAASGGTSNTGGAGGAISITSGAAGSGGNANGGTLTLNSGAVTGTGTSTINLGTASTTALEIGDSTVTKTIDIGGVTSSDASTISIATNSTAADTIAIGNTNASTTLALTGGNDWSISTTGNTFLGDDANANQTLGLTINQGTADNEILAFKSSDVAHGMTTQAETDTYAIFHKREDTSGGLSIAGLKDADGTAGYALTLTGKLGEAADTTKSTSGVGIVDITGQIANGSGVTTPAADSNLLTIRDGSSTKFLFDAEGDLWLAGDIESLGGTEIAINESSADVDFRIESNGNANAFNLDANLFSGVGQLSIGSAAQGTVTAFTVIDNPAITATANQNFYKLLVDNSAAVTVPTGTAAIVASLAIDEPNITETGTVTAATSLYIQAAPTEADNNYALWVDSGNTRLGGRLFVGTSEVNYFRHWFAGSFTSGGSSSVLIGQQFDGALTGASGDTTYLTGSNFTNSVTTQGAAEAITLVSQVRITEPQITIGTATVANSASLYIEGAATEATNNYSLWVDAGATQLDGTLTVEGATTYNSDFDLVFAGSENMTITNTTNTLGASGMLDLASTSSTTDTRTLDLSTTFTSTGATTSYGLYNAWASSAVVTGAAVSQTGYGIYNTATKTGADDATGTYTLYGSYNTASNTGRTAAGTVNTYGGYFSATGDAAGTTKAVGLYATATGADSNLAAIFENAAVRFSQALGSTSVVFSNSADSTTKAYMYIDSSSNFVTGIGSTDELTLNGTSLSPSTSDGNALGTSSLMWSDLFLASGSVINLNNGDVTLTHAADALTIAGGAVTISGSAEGTAALTLTAGDLVITDGDLTLSGGEISATTDDTTTTGFAFVANTITTGNGLTLSATGLTTGEILDLTSTSAPADGSTNEAIDINITHTPTSSADNFRAIDLDVSDGTALANTVYNYDGTLTLTGNAAKVGYGIYQTVTSSSTTADTLYASNFATTVSGIMTTGTRNVYGVYSNPSAGAESTGGTTNVYGGYYKADADVAAGGTVLGYGLYVANGSYDTDGTSTQYGLYVEAPTGADSNYGAYFGGNVGIGTTTPTSELVISPAAGTGDLLVTSQQAAFGGAILVQGNSSGGHAEVTLNRIGTGNESHLYFQTSGTTYLEAGVEAAGNLGFLRTTNNTSLTVASHNSQLNLRGGAGAGVVLATNGTTTALTLDSSQVATFVGNVNADGGLDIDDVFVVANGGAVTANTDVDFVFASGENFTVTATTPTADVVSIAGGTLGDGIQSLYVTGTLPTVPTSNNIGVSVDITSAGSSNNGNVLGAIFNLGAGYTGGMATIGLEGDNLAASTVATENTASNYRTNSGVIGYSSATTAGSRAGTLGIAIGGDRSTGAVGVSIVDKASATNIGVAGYGLNGGASGVQVGGYFGLRSGGFPTFTSAALVADNGTQTSPIFLAQDNGSTVFTIADGGAVTYEGAQTIDVDSTEALLVRKNGDPTDGDVLTVDTTNKVVRVGETSTNASTLASLVTYGDTTVKGKVDIESISNIKDVYVYDTTKDSDGGKWRNDERAKGSSWYNETIDATGAACTIGTNDRCGRKDFPEKAIIITAGTGDGAAGDRVHIFDAKDNTLWMSFTEANGNVLTQSFDGAGNFYNYPDDIFALNGKLYIAVDNDSGGATYGGLLVIDFKTEKVRYETDGGDLNTKYYLGSISQRNSASDFVTTDTTSWFESGDVDISSLFVREIAGTTYLLVGNDQDAVLINESTDATSAYGTVSGAPVFNDTYIAENGDLYLVFSSGSTDNGNHGIYVQYKGAQNGTLSPTLYYDRGTTPALGVTSDLNYRDIWVTTGTSTVDGKSNTIYITSTEGMFVVQEKQGDETNGSVKYYTKDYITEAMTGDIRGMWPLTESSGGNGAITDRSVKAGKLTNKGTETFGASGVRGTAITFNQSNSDYLCSETGTADGTCDDDSNFDTTTGNVTSGAWFKRSASGTDADTIIAKWGNASSTHAFIVYLSSTDVLTLQTENGSGSGATSSGPAITDTNWHHAAAVFDNTNNTQYLYLDGVLVDSDSNSNNTADSSVALTVGAALNGTSNAPALFFRGTIDEPFVTAEALSASQVKQMFTVGYHALQNHTASRITGVTGANTYQQLLGNASGGVTASNNVSSVTVDDSNQFIFAGINAATGGVTVLGADSDSAIDLYDATANTGKDDDAGSQFAGTDTLQVSVSGTPCIGYNSGTTACSDRATIGIVGASSAWMETNDTSLQSTLASLTSPELVKNEITASSIFRVFNTYNYITNSSTAESIQTPSFSIDNQGSLAYNYFGPSATATAWDINDAVLTTGTLIDIDSTALTTGDVLNVTGNALTSGNILDLSSSATAFTGALIDVILSGSNSANTGSLLQLTNSGTANTNTTLYVKHYATGTNNLAFRVDDVSGDTTPFVIDGTGQVGIQDSSPDALLDLDSTDTDGGDFLITNTGIGLSGTVAGITSNSTTTGDILTINGTGLTTGDALKIAGPTSTGVTSGTSAGFISITSDVGSAGTSGVLAHFAPDFSAGSATTSYGVRIAGTDSTGIGNTNFGIDSYLSFTGNAAKTGYGGRFRIDSSSTTADDLTMVLAGASVTGVLTTGTRNVYGVYSNPASTAASTGGTFNLYGSYIGPSSTLSNPGVTDTATNNVYGQYITSTATVASDCTTNCTTNQYGVYVANGTSSTNGTSAKYGLYLEALSGADKNIDINAVTSLDFGVGGTSEITLDGTSFSPTTSDGNALGTGSLMWGDLFLASGSVINLNNGDVTLTHATDALTIGGGAVTISGSAEGTAALTLTAGDLVITDGDLTLSGGEISATTDDTTTTGFAFVANTITSGNGITLSGTGMTTGEILDLTGTWAPTDGSTNEAIDINITHTPTSSADNFQSINLTTTDGTALANTVYNLQSTLTLTGNAAKSGLGIYQTVTSSSTIADALTSIEAVTSATGIIGSGTRSNYGFYAAPASTAANTGGTDNTYGVLSAPSSTLAAGSTENVYGGYFGGTATVASGTINRYGLYVANATMNTTGTSTQYGLYVEALSGADTNVDLAFAGTAPKVTIGGGGTISFTDGTNNLMTLADAGTTGNMSVSGTFNANSGFYVITALTYDKNDIATSNDTGRHTSVKAIDSNTAVVAYYDVTGGDLETAKTVNGGSTWTEVTAQSTNVVGQWASLDTVDSNTYHVAMYQQTDGDAHFVKSTDAGATWSAGVDIDATGGVQTHIDAASSNTIYVAYNDKTNTSDTDPGTGTGRVARSTDAGATWGNTTVTVQGSGGWNDIKAIDTNTAYSIFHSDDGTGGIDCNWRKTVDGAATWGTATNVDTNGCLYVSMDASDSNTIYVAYQDKNNTDLEVAKSVDGGATFAITNVDTVAASTGLWTDIDAYDSNTVIVSYQDGTNGDLKMAKTVNGGSSWTVNTLDDTPNSGTSTTTGLHTGVSAVDGNTYFITYYDSSGADGQSYSMSSSGTAVGIGTSTPTYKLGVSGTVAATNGFVTGGPDIAENYYSDESDIEAGDVVAADRNGKVAHVKKATSGYQGNVLGIISTNPGFIATGRDDFLNDGVTTKENERLVALAGRVPVKITDENGPVYTGDYLTTSSTLPGYAMKATRPGQTIGKALEDFSCNTPDGGPNCQGKVMAFVNTSFADPTNALASLLLDADGSLIVPKIKTSSLLVDANLDINSREATGSGSLNNSDLSANFINVASKLSTIESRINNLESSSSARLASLESERAQTSQIAQQAIAQSQSLDEKVASTSAKLTGLSQQLQDLLASISGNTQNNSASQSSGVSDNSDSSGILSNSEFSGLTPPDLLIASGSATLASLNVTDKLSTLNLSALDATVSGTLKSLGETFLGPTIVAGDFSIDGTLSFTGSSINAFPTLFLQNNPLASLVDIFNGKVTINKDGLFEAESLALGDQSVGEAVILAGQTEVTINSSLITSASHIFLTPSTPVSGNLYVGQLLPARGFKVKLSEPNLSDVKFNWLIIQSKEASN